MDYNHLVMRVYEDGAIRDSRLGMTSEVLGFSVRFPLGTIFSRPKMNRRLGWIEGLHVLGGTFDTKDYSLVAPKLVYPYKLDAAYGLKLAEQLECIAFQLHDNPETRRAIAFIDSPNNPGEHARPCVSSYQFLIDANGNLNLIMNARSWDLVTGFVYDTMVAGMVGLAMANVLGLGIGSLFASAGSGHVYHKDILEGKIDVNHPVSTRHLVLTQSFESWQAVRAAALHDLVAFRTSDSVFQRPSFFQINPHFLVGK